MDTEREELQKTADPRAHYTELDALRGVAILGVVMVHLSRFWFAGTRQEIRVPLLDVDLLDLLLMGYLGVPLFFLLSGYLLTWTEEDRARRGSYSFSSYAKRRVLRLVPAFYVATAVVVLLWPTDPALLDVALLATFLHGFKPSFPVGLDPAVWSLTPEVVFYVLLPLLVLKIRATWQRLAVLAGLLVLSLGTRLLMAFGAFAALPAVGESLDGNRMYFYPTTLLYLFIVGVLLKGVVERRGPGGEAAGALLSLLAVLPVLVLVVFPYLVVDGQLLVGPEAMLAEAMVVALFAAALFRSPVLEPILGWRPLAFLGQISYSMFLLHNTVIYLSTRYLLFELRPWLAKQGEPVVWAVFVVYVLAVLAVATVLSYLGYRYVESPFLRRKPK